VEDNNGTANECFWLRKVYTTKTNHTNNTTGTTVAVTSGAENGTKSRAPSIRCFESDRNRIQDYFRRHCSSWNNNIMNLNLPFDNGTLKEVG